MVGFHFQLLIIPNFSFLHSVKRMFVCPTSPCSFLFTNEDILSLANFFITIFFRMLQPYPKEYRKWESKKREEEFWKNSEKRWVSIYNKKKYFNLVENGEWGKGLQCRPWYVSFLGSCGWQGWGAFCPTQALLTPSRLPKIFFFLSGTATYTVHWSLSAQVNNSYCWAPNIHKLFLSATVDANKEICPCRWKSNDHQENECASVRTHLHNFAKTGKLEG